MCSNENDDNFLNTFENKKEHWEGSSWSRGSCTLCTTKKTCTTHISSKGSHYGANCDVRHTEEQHTYALCRNGKVKLRWALESNSSKYQPPYGYFKGTHIAIKGSSTVYKRYSYLMFTLANVSTEQYHKTTPNKNCGERMWKMVTLIPFMIFRNVVEENFYYYRYYNWNHHHHPKLRKCASKKEMVTLTLLLFLKTFFFVVI